MNKQYMKDGETINRKHMKNREAVKKNSTSKKFIKNRDTEKKYRKN